MDPIIGGSLITAGANLLGGLFGRKNSQQQFDANAAMQREFAQHGVQWRVEDAQAAGVHPLYALGGSGATYSPSSYVDPMGEALSNAGQNLGRAVQAQETVEQRTVREMGLRVQASQIRENDARALYYENEAARAAQSARAATPFPVSNNISSASLNAVPLSDRIDPNPDKVTSTRFGDRSISAGTHAAMREYTVSPSGLKMRLPYSEEGPSEAMENLGVMTWPMVILHNINHYGMDWGTRFMREFVFGQSPKYRSTDPRLKGSSMYHK